ncbi:hypothetical protein ACIRSU_31770 [Streptomyces sp. NPDC101160]|uniref:hypothetical protein n=1 Tax=Streptomyces sp. NPDC101160 TaxID=3366118 RepID=UPI00380AAE6A
MKGITQRVLVLTSAALTAAAVSVAPAPLAQARAEALDMQLGIQFNPDGNPGQCGGRTGEQWKYSATPTDVIRFDTDSRAGGCQLAFGIYDPENELPGLIATYTFRSTPGGDPAQCGNQGTHRIPVSTTSRTFGPVIRIDTDNRQGGCDLTFALSTPRGESIGVNYTSDGDRAQCGNALPPSDGSFSPVDNDREYTLRIDTDDRPGGCRLRLRLDVL